jgi:hypothetical protein
MKKKIILLGGLAMLCTQILTSCKKSATDTNQTTTTNPTGGGTTTPVTNKGMIVESLTGAITVSEILAFKTYMQTVSAPATNDENIWVFGNAGKAIEACGLMYEATGDIAILDRMIYYCDAALSGRNDLASAVNGGQRKLWTGSVEPVWPSSDAATIPAGAGVEQGDVLSHMVYCSKLILQKPAIWNTAVGIGDVKGYGATYKARALKYIEQADYVNDVWILPRFVRVSDNKLYFPGAPNTYKPNEAAPWNQLFMVTNSMIRLVQCHLLLSDAPARVTKYDAIVQANVDWFKANLTAVTSKLGSACYNWKYAIGGSVEDTNHFAYDAEGFWLAYDSGRYGVTLNDMKPMANTYFDIVLTTVTNGIYAGKVDSTTGTGNSDGDNYVRDEYYYLADIRKDKYTLAANININAKKIASSPPITGRLLWLKNKRFLAGDHD